MSGLALGLSRANRAWAPAFRVLGTSWAVNGNVRSNPTKVASIVILFMTTPNTTHEPSQGLGFRISSSRFRSRDKAGLLLRALGLQIFLLLQVQTFCERRSWGLTDFHAA